MVERFSKILILAALTLNSKQALSSDPVGGSRPTFPIDLVRKNRALKRKLVSVKTDAEEKGVVIEAFQDQLAKREHEIVWLQKVIYYRAGEFGTAGATNEYLRGRIRQNEEVLKRLLMEREALTAENHRLRCQLDASSATPVSAPVAPAPGPSSDTH